MTITKTTNANNVTLALVGRLDTITSIQLTNEFDSLFSEDSSDNVTLDMKGIDYISSAGLRVLLVAQKQASSKSRKFELTGVSGNVKDVLDMTGFSNILTIK
jgi:anti-sigma B factor antagonist